jgi:TetR/AcrR family transcriptional regulator, transcriptional repressor for nem operon
MRRSREDTAETRRRIVAAASRLIRARGIAAVGIADVMGVVGLTVGGFYRHFESKQALVCEAIGAAARESAFSVESVEAHGPRRVLDAYLSLDHRKDVGGGCPIAALCSEVAHEGRETKQAFTDALRRLISILDEIVGDVDQKRRDRSLHATAAAIGALVLSRATDNEVLASEILAAVRRQTPIAARRSGLGGTSRRRVR